MIPKTKILLANYVLPIVSDAIENGAIVIEADKILAVGNRIEIEKKHPNAETEDFGEAVIMPGLINCHSHLELSAMRGFLDDVENDFFKWLMKLTKTRAEILTAKDLELSATLGALEGAHAGVTTFADIGRFGQAGFSALKKTGLRGIVFQETEFSPQNEKAKEDFQKLEEKFLALREQETELVVAGISPHAPYTVSRKLFEKIADYSLAQNIPVSIHAAESKMEKDLMLHGKGAMAEFYQARNIEWNPPKISSVEFLNQTGILHAKPLLAHCIEVNDKDINLISKTNSAIAHCPKSNTKFGHSIAPLEKFLDKKIRIGFGTDSVASNNICDLFEEARFAAFLARSGNESKRFLTAKEIIETTTLGAAKAMQLENKIGSLEIGKQADLIAISLKNIWKIPVHNIYAAVLFSASARDVLMTMTAGKEIYRDGKSLMIDEANLIAEIKNIAAKMKS